MGGGTSSTKAAVVNDIPCASRSACWRSLQGWTFGRAAPRRRLRRRAAATMAGVGDDVALAATRAGVGRRNDSGRGVEEDAVTTEDDDDGWDLPPPPARRRRMRRCRCPL